jgi:hypothetical protein
VLEEQFSSPLAVNELAMRFKQGLESKPGGYKGRIAQRLVEWHFFTPDAADDPFAALRGADRPAFEVGARYVAPVGPGNGGLTMTVWDRGNTCDVVVKSFGVIVPAANMTIETTLKHLQS